MGHDHFALEQEPVCLMQGFEEKKCKNAVQMTRVRDLLHAYPNYLHHSDDVANGSKCRI